MDPDGQARAFLIGLGREEAPGKEVWMTIQRVTWNEIEATIHNINVQLYAVEEALIAAGHVPDSLAIMKIGLRDLGEEIVQMRSDARIEFKAPTPATSILLGRAT